MAAPVRRRPGAGSPLAVDVEPVRTPASVAAPVAEPVAPELPAQRASVPREETVAAEPAPPRRARREAPPVSRSVEPEAKRAVTLQMRTSQKARAESAVLHTAGSPGGHRSFAALVDAAVERELARLAKEFNDGVPFEPNTGVFRTGRPFGS